MNQALAQALYREGVEVMFGVMGDANMYIADSFHREAGGRFFSSSHESGAVLMAAGYAAVTGRVGAATVTHGAIANTVSALLDATRGHYPVVVVAGDTAATDTFNLQNVPQPDIVAPTGAGFEPVRSAGTALRDTRVAIRRARVEHRPVVLDIPADLQLADVDYVDAAPRSVPSPVWAPRREVVEEAVGIVAASRRPVLLAGRGATAPAARETLLRLAERVGAPIATTLRAKGLFRGDPFDLGICGTLATDVGLDAIARSDCLLVFGAALSALTADAGDLLTGKRIVQCDTDPAAFGRYFPVDVAITGDAGRTAQALIDLLDEAQVPAAGYRSADLAARLAGWSPVSGARPGRPGTVDLTSALVRLDEIVDPGRTLVVDGGRFSHQSLQIMGVAEPSAYVHALSVGQIGLSVGYGVGAAVGRPGRPTLVVAGDGGFMLGGLTEFTTAVRHRLDLIVAVMNDSAYGAEYYRFAAHELDPSLTVFQWPELAAVAESLGGIGVTVREPNDFEKVSSVLAGRDHPVLIDVKLDPTVIPDPGRH